MTSLVINTALIASGMVSDVVWGNVTVGIAGLYMVGNVGEKFAGK